MELRLASTAADLETVRQLFEEYAVSLDFNVCFQNFAAELARLPGEYGPPSGCLLLALRQGQAAGCVALRPLPNGDGEMKRLYVRPAFRGLGVGKRLAQAVIREARQRGYARMRLETVATMREAQALYRTLGFVESEASDPNPPANVRALELAL